MEQRKTVLVTGASQGIGAALVNAFVERGYNVVATSRSVSQSAEIKASDRVALVDGDIGDAGDRKEGCRNSDQSDSAPSMPWSTTPASSSPSPSSTIRSKTSGSSSSTNLDGFIHLTQLAIRQMLAQKKRRQHRQHHDVPGRPSDRRLQCLGGDDHQGRHRRGISKPCDGICQGRNPR